MTSKETVYSLATFDTPTITGVRTLSEEEFFSYSNQIGLLEKFSHDEQLYRLVELNHSDLKEKAMDYLNQYTVNPRMDFTEFTNQYLDLNRLILNLLSSIRTYLDHSETRLKRSYGNNSDEFLYFKKLTSEAFDSDFAYRFLSKLRNYSQHCGLPSGSISIHSDAEGDKLTLYLVRDSLLKQFDSWGAIVKPELEKQDEKFDILPLIESKVLLLKSINLQVNEMLLKKLNIEGQNLLSLILETQEKSAGTPCILQITGEADNPTMQFKWFPYDIISRITGFTINVTYTGE
jgi:hypothetical protein